MDLHGLLIQPLFSPLLRKRTVHLLIVGLAHTGLRHSLPSYVQQPLVSRPSISVRRDTRANSQACHYTDKEMQVVETLEDIYQQAGFGNTRRERVSSSTLEQPSVLYQPTDIHSINEEGFVSIEVGCF